MRWYDEEVAHNLLWMKPGVKFWYRQTTIGPVAVGRIIKVDIKRQYVLCSQTVGDDTTESIFNFKLALNEPHHMSTYPEAEDGYRFTDS